MEPAYVLPMNLDEDDQDPLDINEEIEEVNNETKENIQELKMDILKFKKHFFYELVSNDGDHDAQDMGAMMTFHALFLQCIAYWIGILDSQPIQEPVIESLSDRKRFKSLTKKIKEIASTNSDARTLVYSLLFHFSTQHPFDLGGMV